MVDYNTFASITGNVIQSLSLSEGFAAAQHLLIFVMGMVIYSVFIYKFYKFIAKKNIFELHITKESSSTAKIKYALKYIFLFPIATFFWFFIIAILLSILSKVLTIGDIFLISMALTLTVRLTAYYSEDLSRDVAKLIPLAMLAIFLLDISTLSAAAPFRLINELSSIANVVLYYFITLIAIEFILRVIVHAKTRISIYRQSKSPKSEKGKKN